MTESLSPPSRIPSANGIGAHTAAVPSIPVVASVPGYFDFSHWYDRMVDTSKNGDWLIEVGVFHGLSLRHLAHRAKMTDRNLTVVGVDWGRGSPEHAAHVAALPHGNLAGAMLSTLVTAGVSDDCALILAPSVSAAKFVPDGSCHMVFIDGDHSKRAVVADIEAWLPKVREGGWISGHDWNSHAGVKAAVAAVFGSKNHMVLDSPSVWAVRV